MRKNLIMWLVIFIVIIAIIGVGLLVFNFFKIMNTVSTSGDEFVNKFYEACNNQDTANIYNVLAHKKFKKTIDFANFDKFIKTTYKKLGKVVKKQRGAWSLESHPFEVDYYVQYEVTREKGETVDSFHLIQNGNSWLLASYGMSSDFGE